MRIKFNRTGVERKALVKAISEITGAEAVYKFMPTCAYEIDYFRNDDYNGYSEVATQKDFDLF